MADTIGKLECDLHGPAFSTYICEHLAANPVQTWYSSEPTEDNKWPDSWCSICHEAYVQWNQWNDENSTALHIKLFCHRCYEAHRARGTSEYVPDYEIPD